MESASAQANLTLPGGVAGARLTSADRLLFGLPAALVVGLVLRVLLIGSKSMWLDEAFSVYVAQASWSDWPRGTADAFHPPLYYYGILHYWSQLGRSDGFLRLPSALFGALAIPLTYLLGRSLSGKGVGLSSAWLVALSPLLVWYSQELRNYSLLVSLALLSSLAFVRLLIRPRVGWWLLYAAATVAAFYTHYFAVLLLPVQLALLLAVLVQRRVRGLGLGAAAAAWPAIVALYSPWLNSQAAAGFALLARRAASSAGARLAAATGVDLRTLAVAAIVAAAAGMALVVGGWLFVRNRGLWPALHRSRVVRAALLIGFILFLVLSVWPRAYSLKQVVVITVPFACVVVAWFWPLERRPSASLAFLLALSAVAALANVVAVPKVQWRDAVQHLSGVYRAGDAIWIVPGYDGLAFQYYNRGNLPLTEINPQDAVSDAVAIPNARVWLVYNTAPDPGQGLGPQVEGRLASALTQGEEWSGHRIRAVLYVPR